MYCPKCGNPDQIPESYCRKCGLFLPDIEKKKKKSATVDDHLKANAFLSIATAVVGLGLAIALYSIFLGRDDTPLIIYLVAGFLLAITFWQVQVFIRTLMMRKQVKRMRPANPNNTIDALSEKDAEPLGLNVPASVGDGPGSVTERTTRRLRSYSSKSEQ